MISETTNKMDFTIDLFVKRRLQLPVYKILSRSSESLRFDTHNESESVYSIVHDIPGYLKLEYDDQLLDKYYHLNVRSYPGFLVDFKDIHSVEEYLKSRFGKNSRYKLKREMKRLEHCFDIKYQMYHGEIPEDQYHFLMEELYRLLEVRSEEKGILNNGNLQTKDYYIKRVRNMILRKEASLFVIFNGHDPIDICLNFHNNNVIFQFIRTYDVAYSKFNTGYTNLIKQFDWCLKNGITHIVFSKGDFYWKRRWCNTVYNYRHMVFFTRKKPWLYFKAVIFCKMEFIRQKLRELGVVSYVQKRRHKKIMVELTKGTEQYDCTELKELNLTGDHTTIDYKGLSNELRREIFNLLYDKKEKEEYVKVYRSHKENSYLIQVREYCLKITSSILQKINLLHLLLFDHIVTYTQCI